MEEQVLSKKKLKKSKEHNYCSECGNCRECADEYCSNKD